MSNKRVGNMVNIKRPNMDYRNLDAWKQSMLLVKNVYELTKKFPKDELFGLTSQVKRAVVSVPSNIAEGIGRNYKKDTIQFLHIFKRVVI